jgi:hypothetical protein
MTALVFAALIGSSALMFVLGRRVFVSPGYGALVAVLFALTPLLWHQLQIEPASLYPLPFVVAWLVATGNIERTAGSAVAGAALGLGVYTSYAAMVMMPLYLLLTIAVFAYARAVSLRQLAVCASAFAAAAAPLAFTMLRHPETFRNTVNAYHLYDADRFNVLQGIREMTSWVGLTARSEVYYDYFNPVFLFLNGGVLLLPLVVLVPAGLYRILTEDSRPLARLVLGGFIAAPFAASLSAQPPTARRILFLTPFAAIVATYGVRQLAVLWRRSNSFAGSPRPARLPGRESA